MLHFAMVRYTSFLHVPVTESLQKNLCSDMNFLQVQNSEFGLFEPGMFGSELGLCEKH